MDTHENVIEFYTGENTILCTFTQRKWITKAKSLLEQYPEEVTLVSENKDGSVVVKMPKKYLHLTRYNRPNAFGRNSEDEEDGEQAQD